MRLRRVYQISICLLAASFFIAAVYFLDSWRTRLQEEGSYLAWAKQIATQAESLAYSGRQAAEKDPIGWAIGFLSQGKASDPKFLRVMRFHAGDKATKEEEFQFDYDKNILDYTRIIFSENRAGVRIQIPIKYVGFLGSRTKFTSDLSVFILFWSIFSFLYLILSKLKKDQPSISMKEEILEKIQQAKDLLIELGKHIREMVREAQILAVAAAKSKNSVGALRDRIHGGIEEIRETRKCLHEVEETVVLAEVIALNAVIDANRMGDEGKHLAGMAEEMHRLLQKMRKLNQSGEAMAERLEIQIEPWATDADIAFHAYDDVKRATQGLDTQIKRTTETLLGQARIILGIHSNKTDPHKRSA